VTGFEKMAEENAVGEVDEAGPLEQEGSQWSHLTPKEQ